MTPIRSISLLVFLGRTRDTSSLTISSRSRYTSKYFPFPYSAPSTARGPTTTAPSNRKTTILGSTTGGPSQSSSTTTPTSPLEELARISSDWISTSELFDFLDEKKDSTKPSTSPPTTTSSPPPKFGSHNPRSTLASQTKTFVRVVIPTILAGIACWSIYSPVTNWIASTKPYDDGVLEVISNDYSQYVQNILTTSALVFSLLTGYTYYFMYTQQEQVFYALFAEVTEAKSLLEQASLVCSGRDTMYTQLLSCLSTYIQTDLKILTTRRLDASSKLLFTSQQSIDDPLESIMYLTSVGEPGVVYDTVRSLRQARSDRLGALQQKLPDVHLVLLRLLGVVVLATFPICGSGSQVYGQPIVDLQAICFGFMGGGLTLVLSVVMELWDPRGGAYNVDSVLSVMVSGLEEELRARMTGELSGFENAQSSIDANPSFVKGENVNENKKSSRERKGRIVGRVRDLWSRRHRR